MLAKSPLSMSPRPRKRARLILSFLGGAPARKVIATHAPVYKCKCAAGAPRLCSVNAASSRHLRRSAMPGETPRDLKEAQRQRPVTRVPTLDEPAKIVISWLWSRMEAVSSGHSPGAGAGRRATESGALRLCLARFLRRRSVGTLRQVGLPRLRRDIRPPRAATMHLAETHSFVSQ